jgi:tetratricopeptide (TPR) repeat protein
VENAARAGQRWLLTICFFVCPLIFFTNLTRNPYVTQIALLHAGVALALAAWAWGQSGRDGGARFPRLPVAPGLALFAAAWAGGWALAWLREPVFFRPAIVAEGARNGLFFAVLCVGTFLLSAALAAEDDGSADVPLGAWAAFALVWGLLWTLYSSARAPASGVPDDFWALAWDPYGALVWALGLAGAGWLTRKARTVDWIHLALCAAFLASAYGVLQYFNMELVWPYTLNPYGGRAVSTFGNPNFLSSFNVALLPVALALFLTEKATPRRVVYAVLFLTLEGAMLATLTRSSWVGALVACSALALAPRLRARAKADPRPVGLLVGVGIAMALFWPASDISTGYTPTVLGRLTEFESMMRVGAAYSPFHQRVLIWSCAWLMGKESPLLGRGGGLFELFYPFYQGVMLHHFTFFHNMRTHANNAHDEILEVFSQTGLVGLGAYLALWFSFFAAARRWAAGRAGEDPVWCGAVAGCAGFLVDNLLNVSLHFAVPAFLFWWLAGMAMGRGARDGAGFWTWRASAPVRRAAAVLFLAGAAAVGWIQTRVWFREAWYFAGFKLARRGDLPGAARALERSRSWGPREVNALYELGNAYARAARYSDAAGAYRESLDANAGYDEIYFNLATVYASNLGLPDEALKFYETSWAINPLSRPVVNALSATYLRDPSKYLDRALPVLNEAVRDFPDDPGFWNNLGYALSLDKQWDKAQAAFERALAIAPEMVQARNNLAGLAVRAHRPPSPVLGALDGLHALDAAIARRDFSDKTLALARSVAARAPKMAKARFLLGSLLLTRGLAAQAVPELQAAAELDPKRAAAPLNLGNAYLALGRADEARTEYRRALAADPSNAAAAARLQALGGAR